MVGTERQNAGELTLGTGGGLERHRSKARDLAQVGLQFFHQLQRTLRKCLVLQRMRGGEARQACDFFVDLRIVLHRTRAKRIHHGIDTKIALRDTCEMTDDLGLAQFGHADEIISTQQISGQWRLGNLGLRQIDTNATGG